MSANPMQIVPITGMSGAGRGTAARVLEEFGWYVVDNLPLELIVRTAEITQNSKREINRLALLQMCGRKTFRIFRFCCHRTAITGLVGSRVFLDASDEVLIRRYNQLRRTHPLQIEAFRRGLRTSVFC